jgi:hypothetical protein
MYNIQVITDKNTYEYECEDYFYDSRPYFEMKVIDFKWKSDPETKKLVKEKISTHTVLISHSKIIRISITTST